jgi:hypothetical protein
VVVVRAAFAAVADDKVKVVGQLIMSGFLVSLRHLVTLSPCHLVMSLTVACLVLPASPDGQSPWHTDFTKALAEARRSGKPLFVVITCRH